MATEIELKPGWLLNDVRRAAERLDQWSSSPQGAYLKENADRDKVGEQGNRIETSDMKKDVVVK